MAFNSFEFVYFFIIAYAIYAILTHKAQNRFLLLASYVFYGSWNWKFLFLILLSTVVDYICGHRIEHTERVSIKRWLLALSVTVNLGILFIFKYYNFFISSLIDLMDTVGIQFNPTSLKVILPVGISFYTFQTMSYTIDVYRGRIKSSGNFLDFALFVAFFPQLVAGPIERAKSLLPQVETPRVITGAMISEGSWLILLGFVKKLVIADNMAQLVSMVFQQPDAFSVTTRICGVYAFALQIYGDFSGYSDIARGVARLMGFDIMLNFRMPYFARNPAEFWRRWHISLSTWLRDYLFLPVFYASTDWFENRGRSARRSQLNGYLLAAMITMVLGGLWHGASWHFVWWGIFHGVLLILHRLLQPLLKKLYPGMKRMRPFYTVVNICLFFQLTCFGWLLFRIERMSDLKAFFSGLTRIFEYPDIKHVTFILVFMVPLFVFQYLKERFNDMNVIQRAPLVIRSVIYAVMVILIAAFAIHEKISFIYFQF